MLTSRDYFQQAFAYQGYTLEVSMLPCEPDEWQWYYWKLYWNDARVNGGICWNPDDAWRLASTYAGQHDRAVHYEKDFWDVESSRWLPKSQLNR